LLSICKEKEFKGQYLEEKKMSCKILQNKAIEKLPENDFNIAKSMRDVGYSRSSSYGGNARVGVINGIKSRYDEKAFWKNFKKVCKELEKTKDYTNRLRALEMLSKILGLQIDKSEVLNRNPEKLVIIDRSNVDKSVDNSAIIKPPIVNNSPSEVIDTDKDK
jgi:hypothetical protein